MRVQQGKSAYKLVARGYPWEKGQKVVFFFSCIALFYDMCLDGTASAYGLSM